MTKLYLRWSDIVELSGKLKSPRFVFRTKSPPAHPLRSFMTPQVTFRQKVGFVGQKQTNLGSLGSLPLQKRSFSTNFGAKFVKGRQ